MYIYVHYHGLWCLVTTNAAAASTTTTTTTAAGPQAARSPRKLTWTDLTEFNWLPKHAASNVFHVEALKPEANYTEGLMKCSIFYDAILCHSILVWCHTLSFSFSMMPYFLCHLILGWYHTYFQSQLFRTIKPVDETTKCTRVCFS
jgi:hypothetical protein